MAAWPERLAPGAPRAWLMRAKIGQSRAFVMCGAGGIGYTAHRGQQELGFTLLHVERSVAISLRQTGVRTWLQDTTQFAPYALTILRIVTALLFFEHGTSRLFGFPSPLPSPAFLSMYWFAGAFELVCGALVAFGLFTRAAAFIASGEMAFAYFLSHAPHGFFPIINRGDGAILYCFVFLYIAVAGAGPWSLDGLWKRKA